MAPTFFLRVRKPNANGPITHNLVRLFFVPPFRFRNSLFGHTIKQFPYLAKYADATSFARNFRNACDVTASRAY